MKRPIIILVLSLIGGFYFYEKIHLDIYAISLVALSFLLGVTKYPKYALLALVCFCLSCTYTGYLDMSSKEYLGKTYQDLTCMVVDRNQVEKSYSYILKLGGQRVLYKDKNKFEIGSILHGKLEFGLVSGKNNYRTFSYRKYMKSKRVFLSAKGSLSYAGEKDFFYSLRGNFINYVEDNIDKKVNGPARDFAKSIVLGKNRIDKDLNDKYKNLGLGHILAVSGLHISIIIYSFERLAKILEIKRQTHILVVSIVLVAYGLLIGFPISLIRALSMFILRWLAIYLKRVFDGINSIFFALFVCLLINPYYLYSSSLYFSFAAIFSIVYLVDLIKKSLHIKARSYDGLISVFAIQVGMLPVQIYFFDKLNLLTIAANLILLPLVFIPVLASFLLSILPLSFSFLTKNILEASVFLINQLLDNLSQEAFLSLTFFNITFTKIAFYYLFLIMGLNLYRFKKTIRKEILTWSALGLIFCMALSSYQKSKIVCTVDFIDVGQGDAILFRTKNKNIMVDFGGEFLNKEKSYEDLFSYLFKMGVLELDAAFLTHDDFDHVGNFKPISKKMNINKIYAASTFKNIDNSQIQEVKIGQKFNFDGVEFEVLNGKKSSSNQSDNESSLGMLVKAGTSSILLMADIEKQELKLAKQEVDILKVGHHGSKNATSDDFLRAIKPKDAIISVGINNRYGHPSDQVIARLKKHDSNIYKTSTDGLIRMVVYKEKYYLDYYYRKYSLRELLERWINF